MSESGDKKSLLEVFDAKDSFMKGHDVRGKPSSTFTRRSHNLPLWIRDKKAIQELLLKVFPKLRTDPRQQERAGRWARVIQLFFRFPLPARMVAGEMGISEKMVYDIALRIKRAAAGLRTTGRPRTAGKPGRPKSTSIRF